MSSHGHGRGKNLDAKKQSAVVVFDAAPDYIILRKAKSARPLAFRGMRHDKMWLESWRGWSNSVLGQWLKQNPKTSKGDQDHVTPG